MKNKWESLGFAAGILCLALGVVIYSLVAERPATGGPLRDKVKPVTVREKAFETETPAVPLQETQKTDTSKTPTTSTPSPGDIVYERSVSPASYTVGAPLDVVLTLKRSASDRINALAVVESLPEGLVYNGIKNGTRPVIEPKTGTKGPLTFVWVTVPPFPFTFAYRVQTTANIKGAVQLHGQAIYRKLGPELRSEDVVSTVSPSAP